MELRRDAVLRRLVEMQYERNDIDFHRGTFRVRGDTVEVFPAYEEERAIRIEFFGDEIEAISEIDPLRGKALAQARRGRRSSPARHYVTPRRHAGARRSTASSDELRERLDELRGAEQAARGAAARAAHACSTSR